MTESSTIDPVEARRLRIAMKKTEALKEADAKAIVCDEVSVCSPLHGGPKQPRQLVLKKDGVDVAYVTITNATLKRLKSEMAWWNSFHSGAMKVFRHNGHLHR